MSSDLALELGHRTYGPGWRPVEIASAPGRLELLGNHIDYNGGLVLAGAIDRTVDIAITRASGSRISLVTEFGSTGVVELDPASLAGWQIANGPAAPADYVRGVIASLLERSIPIRDGLELAVAGNVPVGFGMSSSAALCVAGIFALVEELPSPRDIVLIAQEAEHRAGSPVGAMDQSASVAGQVILFNGTDISWNALTPDLGNYVFAVANSGIHHALSESSYPVRVAESQEALALIRERVDPNIANLAQVDLDTLESLETADWLSPTLTSRVRHVVQESERVREGVRVVKRSDWAKFGDLMRESGRSSDANYEISHPAVEELVGLLNAHPGVLGARMMGGGEGGPALALLDADAVPDVQQHLEQTFFRDKPVRDAFQVCAFGAGATRSGV